MNLLEKYQKSNLFGQYNNLTLNVIEKGHIEYTMKVEDKHFALPGVVHGGAIAGLMDAVLSVAAFSAIYDQNKSVATVEFKINYLKTVRSPGELRGVGKIVSLGKRMIITHGDIFNDSGELVAVGTGSIIPIENRM